GDRREGLGSDHAGAAGGGAGGAGPHQRQRAAAAGDRGAAGPHRRLPALNVAGWRRPARAGPPTHWSTPQHPAARAPRPAPRTRVTDELCAPCFHTRKQGAHNRPAAFRPRERSDSGNAQASGPVASSWGESASGGSGAVPSGIRAGLADALGASPGPSLRSGAPASSGESASGTSVAGAGASAAAEAGASSAAEAAASAAGVSAEPRSAPSPLAAASAAAPAAGPSAAAGVLSTSTS